MEKGICEYENLSRLNYLPSNKSFAIYTFFLALQNIHYINCKTIAILKNIFELIYYSFPNILILLLLMTILIIFLNIIKGTRTIKTLIISNIVYITTILCYVNLYGSHFKQNPNQNNDYITIFMGVFAALTTFITIILVYYDKKQINKTNELSSILSTINKTVDEIILNLLKKQENYSTYDNLQLNMYRYIDLYTGCNNNLKSTNILSNVNIFLLSNVFTSLYFSIFFASINILDIQNLFLIVSMTVIILSVAFISYESFKENENFLALPSPNDILTPTNIIDILTCRKYVISKYLPMKLFYIGTKIIVKTNTDKFNKLLQRKTTFYHPKNHMLLLFLFKYNIDINKIHFTYTADLGYQKTRQKLYLKALHLINTKETYYEYEAYIQPRFSIYMPNFSENFDEHISINIIDSTNTTQYLNYYNLKDKASTTKQIYYPSVLHTFLPNEVKKIAAEDINVDKYFY